LIGSITSAATTGFAAIGAGGALAIGLKAIFEFFGFPRSELHFGIVDVLLLVFFYGHAGLQATAAQCQ
jgi:hypothetical protein